MTIKRKIKAILSDKGITQNELAIKMNIKPETLSRTINGNPTLKTLTDIADNLNVSIEQLFTTNNPKGYIEYQDKIYAIRSKDDIKNLLTIVPD